MAGAGPRAGEGHGGWSTRYAHLVYPAALFLVISATSVWLWRFERAGELESVAEATELICPGVADRFGEMVTDGARPVRRLARELATGKMAGRKAFREAARSVQVLLPSLPLIAWVDGQGKVNAVASARPHPFPEGEPLPGVPEVQAVLEAACASPRVALVAGQWKGRPSQWLAVAVATAERDAADAPFRGAVLARCDFGARAAQSLFSDGTRDWFDILIHDGQGQVIYSTGPPRGSSLVRTEHPLRLFETTWYVELRPTDHFIASRRGAGPMVIMAGGLMLATLASLGLAQALAHRQRDRQRTSTHLAALEALAKISGAINDKPGASTDVLAQLAQVASRLMNMPMSSITLYEPCGGIMRVVYRQALPNPENRNVYQLREVPCSAECMRTGRPLLQGDTEAPGSPFKPGHMRRFGIRSLILLPLTAGQGPMGVLMLAAATPRRFRMVDRRLAELWMAEASAILSNRMLYEGMNEALRSQQRMLQQREVLYDLNTRIQRSASLDEALQRVAELAPGALDVDACVVGLTHSAPGCIQVAAVTPAFASEAMRDGVVVECETCTTVLSSGVLRAVEDTADLPVRGFDDMGSVLFVPLKAGTQTIGLLTLLRRQHGRFEEGQVRSAELFASRVAVAIERTRLYAETRRQADTNAVLLRELNHRVGNNFASIIGLLKIAASELPLESRQALDRAIARVHLMSRAHELFSGRGVESVRLSDLVHTTLASVSAADDAGVQLSVAIRMPDTRLASSRAITLALVLHELAYNAVEHALGAGGELHVRAYPVGGDPHRIGIDVIDRAAAAVAAGQLAAAGAAPGTGDNGDNGDNGSVRAAGGETRARHTGIGLQLVRNLVARELGGRFSLTRDASGTKATVEFSVEEECECRL